ncbi:hypothetical protein ACFQPG_02265 [Sphingomonas sp. GCM10030256]|uniref:hypothetical protein n=1 Tax=Sphingomonas sp. GCM10030256 TaxID=3273427 RepID=UPI003610F4CC
MGPVTYVIAILGCADGSAACQPVATLPARYESQAACTAATTSTLAANTEFDFPTIIAQCRTTQPAQPASAKPQKKPVTVLASREG